MPTSSKTISRFYFFLFQLFSKPCPQDMPFKRTVVFAPHPDDETLGCGGLIRIKKNHNTQVKIIFITDGSNSHHGFYEPNTLTDLRKAEATKACALLGVPENDLVFLNIPDSQINSFQKEIQEEAYRILKEFQPEEIFIPHRLEETADHFYTYKIILKASKDLPFKTRMYEYLIWSWMQWPSIPAKHLNKSRTLFLKNLIRKVFGLRLLFSVNCRVNIINQAELKKNTVNVYLTQTQPILAESNYPTLKNFCEGQFLNACLQPYEFFRLTKNNERN